MIQPWVSRIHVFIQTGKPEETVVVVSKQKETKQLYFNVFSVFGVIQELNTGNAVVSFQFTLTHMFSSDSFCPPMSHITE